MFVTTSLIISMKFQNIQKSYSTLNYCTLEKINVQALPNILVFETLPIFIKITTYALHFFCFIKNFLYHISLFDDFTYTVFME